MGRLCSSAKIVKRTPLFDRNPRSTWDVGRWTKGDSGGEERSGRRAVSSLVLRENREVGFSERKESWEDNQQTDHHKQVEREDNLTYEVASKNGREKVGPVIRIFTGQGDRPRRRICCKGTHAGTGKFQICEDCGETSKKRDDLLQKSTREYFRFTEDAGVPQGIITPVETIKQCPKASKNLS